MPIRTGVTPPRDHLRVNAPWKLHLVTGGQTGVDTGALWAARHLQMRWAAVLPRGWRREEPMPAWMREHARESETSDYAERTRWIVERVDAVLLIAPHLTRGTRLTRDYAAQRGVPSWWLQPSHTIHDREHEALHWLFEVRPTRLMIAGPREGKWPRAEVTANSIALWMLGRVRQYRD